MKNLLFILGLFLPMMTFAQPGSIPPNAFPKAAFRYKSVQKSPCYCDSNYPNTPWVCDAYDYEVAPGYKKYRLTVLTGGSPSPCWDKLWGVRYGATGPNDTTAVVRFIQPETGWPGATIYYYYPEEILFSWAEEKNGAQVPIDEKKLNDPYTQGTLEKAGSFKGALAINGGMKKSYFKVKSRANIKELRLYIGVLTYKTEAMPDLDAGSLKLLDVTDHEIQYEYTHPIKLHPNVKSFYLAIGDQSTATAETAPFPGQAFWLYTVGLPVQVPTLKLTLLQEQDGTEKEISTTEFKDPIQFNEVLKTRLAADGTSTTLIRLSSTESINHLKMRPMTLPKSSSSVTDKEAIGELKLEKSIDKELTYRFTHPNYIDKNIKDFAFDIYTETSGTENVLYQPIVRLTPAPVVFLHGLWSDRFIWASLSDVLLQRGYARRMMSFINYPNGASFQNNSGVLRRSIDLALTSMKSQNILAGRVDVVAHSMGGILTRQYIQSGAFKKDVNKLITLNTPHSGSQIANVIYSDKDLLWYLGFAVDIPTDGALENLKVNSTATQKLNQNPAQNMSEVSVHGIVTEKPIDNTWIANTIDKFNYFGKAEAIVTRTALFRLCSDPNVIGVDYDKCLKEKVFKEPNDWIVGGSSQAGGLPEANLTRFSGINHMEVHSNSGVGQRVADLLAQKNTASSFSRTGYKPVSLAPPDGFNSALSKAAAGRVQIIFPARGQAVRANSTLNVQVQGSPDIKNLLLVFASDSLGVDSQVALNAAQARFPIVLPPQLNQNLKLALLGFDAQGKVTGDTLTVRISSTVANESESLPTTADLTISPNPIVQQATIQWITEERGELEVYDILGRKVWGITVQGKEVKADLSMLKSGIYLVQLKTRTHLKTAKLVKVE